MRSVKFHPKFFNFIASSGYGEKLILWNTEQSNPIVKEFHAAEGPTNVLFTNCGTKIISGDDFNEESAGISIWDIENETKDQIQAGKYYERAIALSKDGNILATADDDIKLFDLRTKCLIATLKGHLRQVKGLDFNADDSQLASCSTGRVSYRIDGSDYGEYPIDDSIRIWDLRKMEQILCIKEKDESLRSIVWQPGTNNVITGGKFNAKIKLWNASNGSLISEVDAAEESEKIQSLAINREGNILFSGANDGFVKMWNL